MVPVAPARVRTRASQSGSQYGMRLSANSVAAIWWVRIPRAAYLSSICSSWSLFTWLRASKNTSSGTSFQFGECACTNSTGHKNGTSAPTSSAVRANFCQSVYPVTSDLGGNFTGTYLVARTVRGDHSAIQPKWFLEDATISKDDVLSFLATSGRTNKNGQMQTIGCTYHL